jgi:hypothetical protein
MSNWQLLMAVSGLISMACLFAAIWIDDSGSPA